MLTHVGTQIINTSRLILRPFDYKDIQSMLENWIADEEIQSLYSEPTYCTYSEVQEFINHTKNKYHTPNYYRWAIIQQKDGSCVGQIAYFLVDDNNHFAEIEYCIGRQYQGAGLATEATMAVIRFGFGRMNLHKVQICHKAHNIPSKRVIEKCGLTYEGTLRDYFFSNGSYIDRLYYSMLRIEFK